MTVVGGGREGGKGNEVIMRLTKTFTYLESPNDFSPSITEDVRSNLHVPSPPV